MKKCSTCQIDKPLDDFYKSAKQTFGVTGRCKSCDRDYIRNHRQTKKINDPIYQEKIKLIQLKDSRTEKSCTKCGIIKTLDLFAKQNDTKSGRSSQCKECRSVKVLEQYYKDNPIRPIKQTKEEEREYFAKYRENNRVKIKEKQQRYYEKNKHVIAERVKYRRATDPLYKLKCSLRTRLNQFLLKNKEFVKTTKLSEYLGCSIEALKAHIEAQFEPGMSWDNHSLSTWHLDHIIPLNSATCEDELYKLCHYTNLQPLWAEENLKKSDKILK